MRDSFYKEILDKLSVAYCYQKIIRDRKNRVSDVQVIDANQSFIDLVGIEKKDPSGVSLKKLLPNFSNSDESILDFFDELSIVGSSSEFCVYFEKVDKWFSVSVIPKEKDHFLTLFEDITQAKERESMMNSMIKNVPGVIFRCDNDEEWTMRYISEGVEYLTGYTSESFIDNKERSFVDIIHPEDEKMVSKIIREHIETKKPYSIIYRIIRSDGGIRKVSENGRGIFDNRGNVIFIDGTITDVSFEEDLKHEVLEAKKRYDELAEVSRSVIWEIEKNGLYRYLNFMSEEVYGYKPEELIGKKHYYDIAPEEDREELRNYAQSTIKEQDSVLDFENRVVRKDGEIITVQTRGLPVLDRDGKFIAFRGIDTDITEKKKIEEAVKYRNDFQEMITEISSSFMNASISNIDNKIDWVLKRTGEFFDVDRAYVFSFSEDYKRMSNTHEWCKEGVSSQKDLIQNYPMEKFPWWKSKVIKNSHVHVPDIEKLPPEASFEKKEFRKQEIKSLLSVPLSYSDVVVGFFGFDSVHNKRIWYDYEISYLQVLANLIADAGLKVSAEKGLMIAREKAEAANLAKGQFLANISHEIRTPVNIIAGSIEFLSDQDMSEDQKKLLDDMKKAGADLMKTVDGILTISKTEVDTTKLDVVNFSIKPIVRSITEMLSLKLSKDVELMYSIDKNLKTNYFGDVTRFHQLLLNGLSNAVKFTEKGSIKLSIDLLEDDGSKSLIAIKIEDTGIGMSKDFLERVYEPFAQENETSQRKCGGSGLGLPIMRKISRMMGGDVNVESELGKGTTLSIEIKLNNGISSPSVDSKVSIIRASGGNQSSEVEEDVLNISVLLVEDNEVSKMLTKRQLEKFVSSVELAENGIEALKLINEKTFDLIIMDIQMPEMDGITATAKIREKDPNVPIVGLSTHSMEENKMEAEKSGMNDYIVKPISTEDLKLRIRSVMEGRIK